MRTPKLLYAAMMLGALPQAASAMCIRTYDIRSTEIKSDRVILFHMSDGKVLQNTLPSRCSGLRTAVNGFTYTPTNPGTQELCDNLGTFRVNDGLDNPLTNGTGAVCMWGAFTPVR